MFDIHATARFRHLGHTVLLYFGLLWLAWPKLSAGAPVASDDSLGDSFMTDSGPSTSSSSESIRGSPEATPYDFFEVGPARWIMPPPGQHFFVKVRDRRVVERLLRERREAGFQISGTEPHAFYVFRLPDDEPPSLATAAIDHLYAPGTLVSVDRHLTAGAPGRERVHVWHLMTPAPVTQEWYHLMNLPDNPTTIHRQPMLVYELHYSPTTRFLQFRLVGVEIVQNEEHPMNFLSRWRASSNLHSFVDVVDDIRRLP